MSHLSIRELELKFVGALCDYWSNSSPEFLTGMGVDLTKLPSRDEWEKILKEQISQSYQEKKSYCIIWLVDEKPIGHSNINRIIFGEEAYMHLHIWDPSFRTKGLGTRFVKMTLPAYFEKFELKKLCCEPFSKNPAPHKTLEKLGFRFIKEYTTVPGWINFEQPVKHWELTKEKFNILHGSK